MFRAFNRAGVKAEPAIDSNEFRDEVWQQLLGVQGVLVRHNFIEGGLKARFSAYLEPGTAERPAAKFDTPSSASSARLRSTPPA